MLLIVQQRWERGRGFHWDGVWKGRELPLMFVQSSLEDPVPEGRARSVEGIAAHSAVPGGARAWETLLCQLWRRLKMAAELPRVGDLVAQLQWQSWKPLKEGSQITGVSLMGSLIS